MNYKYLTIIPILLLTTACDRENRDTNASNQAGSQTMEGDVVSPYDTLNNGGGMSEGSAETIGSGEGSKIGSTEPSATTNTGTNAATNTGTN